MAYGEINLSKAIQQRAEEIAILRKQIAELRRARSYLAAISQQAKDAMNDKGGEQDYNAARSAARDAERKLYGHGIPMDLSGFPEHWNIV